ncbi:uncharacterized protein LOC128198637 [Bicyclus anynana]|uniref:Uncharacterized protein LOC128198637 n=1 Tax=Bicyclus anynana TaxID=110368 RepID=A0ABM3LPC7_BICAN|nr:uncharacterized protein LOC128198637 [Bicyclus anynana]
MWRNFSLVLVLCAVIEISCWSDNCNGCRADYTRNKRAKYYSFPSYKYSRPTYYNRGPLYSYTSNDIGPAAKPRPYKVSKRPINEGLGDEDFDNLINYLSNKDLDKIIKFAAEKEVYADRYRDSDNYEYNDDSANSGYEEVYPKMYVNGPNVQFDSNRYNSFAYSNPDANNIHWQVDMNNIKVHAPVNTEESEETEQLSLLDEYIKKEINVMSNQNNVFTDSSTVKEEELPKPLNLREDDYDVSFTNNVPSIAKPESAYILENFGDLPLMEYENSKLEKVNSYSVPHYSVISPSDHRPRFPSSSPSLPSSQSSPFSSSVLSLINAPEVEPAPPVSAAKEQSDAHLKAIKIWTHKSKGTAYTLHDDGTLSLEIPARPRHKYS